MNWFWLSLVCVIFWGFADLFYKKGSDEEEEYSYLKIAFWVGLVMGIGSFILLPFSSVTDSMSGFINRLVHYAPASLSYIVSMILGYVGLRYLTLSVASPLQNASGGFTLLVLLFYYFLSGKWNDIRETFSPWAIIGLALIIAGSIGVAVFEKEAAQKSSDMLESEKPKHRFGKAFFGLLFPLLYCIFDTLGTSFDGILLTESGEMALSEIDVLILYGFTFFLVGIGAYIFLRIKTKKFYAFYRKSERPKILAALLEEGGQIFYVYAMAENPVMAAPMIGSYCILSVVLSAVFLKERWKKRQGIAISAVIAGILILGIIEGA